MNSKIKGKLWWQFTLHNEKMLHLPKIVTLMLSTYIDVHLWNSLEVYLFIFYSFDIHLIGFVRRIFDRFFFVLQLLDFFFNKLPYQYLFEEFGTVNYNIVFVQFYRLCHNFNKYLWYGVNASTFWYYYNYVLIMWFFFNQILFIVYYCLNFSI